MTARRVMNQHERNGLRMLALTCFQKLRRRERAKLDAGTVGLDDYWNRVEAFHEALQKLDAILTELARGDKDFRPVPTTLDEATAYGLDRIIRTVRRVA